MIGTYETLDHCLYEVFWHQPDKRVKAELKAKCLHSTVRGDNLPSFPIQEDTVARNLKFHTWKKV